MQQMRYKTKGAKKYREVNKRVQNIYQKYKRFSIDGQIIAQSYTIKSDMVTVQF